MKFIKKSRLSPVEMSVQSMYANYPFPSIPIFTRDDLHRNIVYDTVYYLVRKYLESYPGRKIKILDAGCGTGELSLGLADSGRTISAMDRNTASLDIARKRARKFNIKNVIFKKFDLVRDPLPLNYYDFVFSIGVIHHIPNTEQIFAKLAAATKPGGYITIGLYNPFGMLRKRVERKIITLLAGNNLEKKVQIAARLVYNRPVTLYEKISLADTYAHPLQQHFSVETALGWFDKYDIDYIASEPPIELRKSIWIFFELVKQAAKGRINLLEAWHQTLSRQYRQQVWEKSAASTFFIQVVWMLLGAIFGRGEFYNIVGRKRS